ncbi:MAG: phosphoribosylanthranilate isomerase [Anaerolineales bacterium]
MKIKICGIKNLEEARWAIASGADFLGFNFYPPSPRAITVAECCQITKVLRAESPHALLVGVFVNQSAAEIRHILERCDLDLAQLSGDEGLEDQEVLGERAYKALRISKTFQVLSLEERIYRRKTPPALLVDASVPGEYGGTGRPADWQVAAQIALARPIFLAGGLTPLNVAEAIRQVRPWGVDVASGVETAPGKKDREKITAFIENARQAFAELRME